MARVTTLVYLAKGKKPRSTTDSTTPTVTQVRPSLVSNGQVFYPPNLVQDGLLRPSLIENAQEFYSPIVSGAAVFISPPLLTNTQTFYPPTINQTIYGGLTTNEQTFYEPSVVAGLSLAPSLVENTQTFYGPQLNLRIDPGLITNEQEFFAPSIVTGTALFPALLTNEQTFYAAQVNQKITPALVTNTQTFYGPTVASGVVLRPSLFANGQAFYSPQVNLKVIAAFITNTQTFYSPIVGANLVVGPGLVTNTQTFYPPQVNLKLTPSLITNTQTFFAPAVTLDDGQLVSPSLITNSQTFYAPKVNLRLRPSLVTNVNGFFPPTVSNGANPGYALSTPTVTVLSAAGDAPEITLGINSDHYAGYYLDIERSTVSTKNASDGSYATPTLKIAHQIAAEQVAALEITNADLAPSGYVDPTGTYFQQYRIRREDGALSAWVEISGTVTASVAKLTELTGLNKHTALTVADGGLSFSSSSSSGATALAKANVASVSAAPHFEVELTALGGAATYIQFGICESGLVVGPGPSGVPVGSVPGAVSNNGFTLRIPFDASPTLFRNGGQQSLSTWGVPAIGDIYAINYSAGQVILQRRRSGANNTLAAIGITSRVPTSLVAFAGTGGTGSGTRSGSITFASADFAITPATGHGQYA